MKRKRRLPGRRSLQTDRICWTGYQLRRRASRAEMFERKSALIDLVYEHGPSSVRHIFYRAVVTGVTGITKNQSGYDKVQRAVLELRRSGDIPYSLIVDNAIRKYVEHDQLRVLRAVKKSERDVFLRLAEGTPA